MKLERNSDTGVVKFTLSQPVINVEGAKICELYIPPVLRMSHMEGIEQLCDPSGMAPFYVLLKNICGLSEENSRQLSLYDIGVLTKLITKRTDAWKHGYNAAEEES